MTYITFPNDPTIGDTRIFGDLTYTWDGTSWNAEVTPRSEPIYSINAITGGDILLSTDEVPEGLSNQYYTDAKVSLVVDAAINNLVGAAPATLDTLEELSAALGDDPNLSVTLGNLITDVDNNEEIEQLRTNFINAYAQNYKEITMVDGVATQIDVWETSSKITKLFTKILTYSMDKISSVATTDHTTGKTLTKTFTYPSDNLTTITEVVT